MKISVKLEASQKSSSHTFNLNELDVTQEEWEQMNESERNSTIEKAVFGLPEQPFWMVDSYTEKQ